VLEEAREMAAAKQLSREDVAAFRENFAAATRQSPQPDQRSRLAPQVSKRSAPPESTWKVSIVSVRDFAVSASRAVRENPEAFLFFGAGSLSLGSLFALVRRRKRRWTAVGMGL
jgi:hypothetical protein